MKSVVKIEMNIERLDRKEIELNFILGIEKSIDDILTEEERERINESSQKMSDVIANAVARELEEEEKDEDIEQIRKILEKRREKAYNKLSEEDKKEVDEFKEKLDTCSSFEDLFDLISEII